MRGLYTSDVSGAGDTISASGEFGLSTSQMYDCAKKSSIHEGKRKLEGRMKESGQQQHL